MVPNCQNNVLRKNKKLKTRGKINSVQFLRYHLLINSVNVSLLILCSILDEDQNKEGTKRGEI